MSLRMRPVRRFAWPFAARRLGARPAINRSCAERRCSETRVAAERRGVHKKIKEYLQDPRITTELVDHLPASSTVPTPLKFLGRIVGTPGELTYAKDMYRYFDALDAASDASRSGASARRRGRDIIVAAIGDEATIRDLDKYKGYLNALTDPRKTPRSRRARSSDREADLLVHQRHALAGEPAGPRC
jgi:hypothetical protein